MGAQKRLLAAVVALLCIFPTVCGAEGCSGFRHLENGQTFFRYGGLLVIFHCHRGYKLHGHKTNSCVSGHWSRDPPVCVGSGCSHPGPLIHGTSSRNEAGSWAVFSCNSGFKLHGSSMLYCKGRTWNDTKPVCKEFDMMRPDLQKPNVNQNLQSTVGLKTQQQSHYDSHTQIATKDIHPKFGFERHQKAKVLIKDRIQAVHPGAQETDEAQRGPDKQTGGHTSDANAVKAEADKQSGFMQETQVLLTPGTPTASRSTSPSAAVSFTQPSVSDTQGSSSSASSVTFAPASPLHHTRTENPSTPHPDVTSSETVSQSPKAADEDQKAHADLQCLPLFQPGPADEEHPIEHSPASTPSDAGEPALDASLLPTIQMKTEYPTSKMKDSTRPALFSRRPVCPYPPVPAHGTFYFRNIENPGPREFRHYIQYACYPGYTLAHGDVHSYCQRGGVWSGVTPVCLELTPCSVNNGGCSQLCVHSQHYNQSSSQTQTRTQCLCRPGFTLLDDGRTCRDFDECVEGQPRCQQRCINTFGSFKCACDDGYQPAPNQTCTDVDECLLPTGVTGCVFGCINTSGSFHCRCPVGYSLQSADGHCRDTDECAVNDGLGPCSERCLNSPGSYRCSCSYGHTLAGDGHTCVAECPSGYKKQAAPDNSTSTLKEECVDINECEEERCEWQCVNLPGSYHCICPRGYTLQRDGRRCKDINECNRKNGGCSHLCINQRGTYKCACPPSHRLSPYSWKKCVPKQL
ncbi:latent-transforming growth factor beta-binding protein 4 [Sphaeramia orbicularis]|uniref:latent-transforming growth factor beta-binding protein 4 n=1 Tax=Sphaeramia orbicularis TaxID=375764 RepID=UPI00117E343A|nr:latent-transforming growth factor beta-binding protein 4-like [Sphaeramia orbicularis]